jgi:hypothetical protein
MNLPEHGSLQYAVIHGHLAGRESAEPLAKSLEHGPLQYAVMSGHSAGIESPVQLMTPLEHGPLPQHAVIDGHLAGSE